MTNKGSHFARLANASVRQLSPYIPGRPPQDLLGDMSLNDSLLLASNENVLGPSAKAMAAAQAALKEVHLYPDGAGNALRQALAIHHKISVDQIVLGNGSNDVLLLLACAFLSKNTSVVYSKHAFIVYDLATTLFNATALVADAKQWGHDPQAILNLVRNDTRMIFIANPNNPTGTWLSQAQLISIMQGVSADVLVVVDEAYYEYVTVSDYPDTLSLQKEFPNLVLTRTFSKIYGLAGLRIGYAIADASIIVLMNKIRQPFNVNHIAQKAAIAALTDRQHVNDSRAMNTAGLEQLTLGLRSLGLEVLPSIANFVCFAVGDENSAQACYQALLKQGVIVRSVGVVYDMPGFIRVTVGTVDQNIKFLDSLAESLKP